MENVCTVHLMNLSKNYRVLNEYGAAYIQYESQQWKVEECYGDPEAALITWDEQWAIIFGEGVLLVHLPPLTSVPHKKIHLDTGPSLSGAFQIEVERNGIPCLSCILMGQPGSISWEATWFEAAYQNDRDSVRPVSDPYGNEPGIYQINLAPFNVSRSYSLQDDQ